MARSPSLDRLAGLIEAAAAVVGEGDLDHLLRRLVSEARAATGAPFAALGVIGEHGVLTEFIYDGIDERTATMIGHLPTGRGVLGTVIRENRTIVLEVISDHPDSYGFPPHHPEMTSFLGVPVAVADRAFGNLYLTEKEGGFTADDVVVVEALSRIAGAAVQTSRLQNRLRALAVIEERNRIAADLHDSVIQDLFAVGLGLQSLATRVPDQSAAQVLDDSVDRLDHSVNTLRNYIFELKDSSQLTIPLGERLQEMVARMGSVYPSRVRLTIEGLPGGVGDEDDTVLMLATEALSNALRHAGAGNVEITVGATEDQLLLEVVDDGVGFDPTVMSPGMGLSNMKARAATVGGTLGVKSEPGQGTTVTCRLPRRM